MCAVPAPVFPQTRRPDHHSFHPVRCRIIRYSDLQFGQSILGLKPLLVLSVLFQTACRAGFSRRKCGGCYRAQSAAADPRLAAQQPVPPPQHAVPSSAIGASPSMHQRISTGGPPKLPKCSMENQRSTQSPKLRWIGARERCEIGSSSVGCANEPHARFAPKTLRRFRSGDIASAGRPGSPPFKTAPETPDNSP